jgi:replication factor A1
MSFLLEQKPSLTRDAVYEIAKTLQNQVVKTPQLRIKPIMQVIHHSEIIGNKGERCGRLKITLSDSIHFISCMYGKNDLTTLSNFCFVRINDFLVKTLHERIIVIILSMQVIYPAISGQERLGNPVDFEKTTLLQDLFDSTLALECKQTPTNLPSPIRSSCVDNNNQQSFLQNERSITPISLLSPYNKKWKLQGRITSKSEITTWSNSRGDGSLFNIVILDAAGTDIRATFFKEGVTKFYNMLEISKVYTFAGGRVKQANVQYNSCQSSFEIVFDELSEIHLITDDGSISHQLYNFIGSISNIEILEADVAIDLIAVIKQVGECMKMPSKKTGNDILKCELTLIDDSNTEISLTLWGNAAAKAKSLFSNQPIVAIRRALTSEFNSKKSLRSNLNTGGIDINPFFLPNAKKLHSWWLSQSNAITTIKPRNLSLHTTQIQHSFDTIAERSNITKIKEHSMEAKNVDKRDYFTIKGYCKFISNNREGGAWYAACPNSDDPCRNLYKVTQSEDGSTWECKKCCKHYPKPVRRWILSAVIQDYSSSTWVTLYNEQAELLLGGITADEAFDLSNGDDNIFNIDKYNSIFFKPLYQEYIFKCKVKNEINRETNESRLKTIIVGLAPTDYLKESLQLLSLFED